MKLLYRVALLVYHVPSGWADYHKGCYKGITPGLLWLGLTPELKVTARCQLLVGEGKRES